LFFHSGRTASHPASSSHRDLSRRVSFQASERGNRLNITFFTGSVVGYVDNPTAIYTRGLAHGLGLRGNEIRVVEERQNHAFARTLHAVGSDAARHFYDNFRMFQHHTYEPRNGAHLLEWVSREIALIDVAVAVAGLEPELCCWLANISRAGGTRAYLTFEPEALTDEAVTTLELEKFDLILAPTQPAATIAWQPIAFAVADQDRSLDIPTAPPPDVPDDIDPIRAAEQFETILASARSTSRG